MPKGGDLHNHLTGCRALGVVLGRNTGRRSNKVTYITHGYASRTARRTGMTNLGVPREFLLFKNIQASTFGTLDACSQSEFKRLQDLDPREKRGWLESMRLDQPYEGRNEFFEAIWDRINDLLQNPYLICDVLLRNMDAFGQEGVKIS